LTLREAIADGDADRQFQQVRSFITQGVDGIIIAPKDAKTVIPMIRAANAAGIPMVLYNRPADKSDARSVAVVADNYAITRATVRCLAEEARRGGKKRQAAVLIGDLGDMNAISRRDGFEDEAKQHPDVIEVVARIATEWKQEKALAGLTNAYQASPEISLIFTSSDFMLPSIRSVLLSLGKWKQVGEEGHVILGAFDGDATAYRLLVEGYLDADGVQDLGFECIASLDAVLDLKAGKTVPERIDDKGFVIHQGNLQQASARMWGANVRKLGQAAR
ncbi:MAG: sugar ABC transporter substrate-binding protein, partial [Thermoanaerobaculia bacterium]